VSGNSSRSDESRTAARASQVRFLGPPFRGGQDAKRSGAQTGALRLSRKLCVPAIRYAGRVLNDEREDTARRLKAAEIILLHGMPKGDVSKWLGEDMTTSITIHIERQAREDVDDAPTIEGEAERPNVPTITISTVTSGTGND